MMTMLKRLFLLAMCLVAFATLPVAARRHRYSLSPDGQRDRTQEVLRLVRQLGRGDTLALERGEYHFHDEHARRMTLYPSNNTGGEKHVIFPLTGKRDVTIDGQGSTLVFYGQAFPLALLGCRGVTLKNFTITTRYPAAVQFTMREMRDDGFSVQLGQDTGYGVDSLGNVLFLLGGRDVRTQDGRISMHALNRMLIHYLMTPGSVGDKDEFPANFVGVRGRDLGRHMLDFRYYGDTHPKSVPSPYRVAEPVVLNLAEKRLQIACFMDSCDGVRVEHVAIRRFGGMGFVAQRSGNVLYEGVDVWPGEGEEVSVTADVFQCINCFGRVDIRNSRAGHSLDDVINIHGNYLEVEHAAGRTLTLRARHLQHECFFPYRQGDSLEVISPHSREVVVRARVRRVIPDGADHFLCRVEVDIPTDAIPVGSLVENITLCPDVVIEGNTFSHFPHIRLSGRGHMLVRGNDISFCNTALVGNDLAEYWYESGRLSEMVIEGNRFADCNALGGQYVLTFGVSGWQQDAPKIHGRVVLRGNTYDGKSPRIQAYGVREVVDGDPLLIPLWGRGSLYPSVSQSVTFPFLLSKLMATLVTGRWLCEKRRP